MREMWAWTRPTGWTLIGHRVVVILILCSLGFLYGGYRFPEPWMPYNSVKSTAPILRLAFFTPSIFYMRMAEGR